MRLDILEWDSDFFSFKVGLLNIDNSNRGDLVKLPEIMKYQEVRVAYVVASEWNAETHEQLLQTGAMLVDKKITYSKNIEQLIKIDTPFPVMEFQEKYFTNDLTKLAHDSGVYSRFLTDKRFGRKLYEKLYSEWLDKSISGKLADKVWIALDGKKIIGFVTAKKNVENKSGQIGLIAVSENYKGKRVGQSLMEKCDEWYLENNLNCATVVTQEDNKTACIFYETFGYIKEKTDYYYHLWS